MLADEWIAQMWELINHTPLAADRGFLRDRDGAEVWIVMVAATYAIGLDGATTLAPEQRPVCLVPEHVGEPGASSLRRDSDLVLGKVTTDVLLIGHAHAPDGREVSELSVGMAVGGLEKILSIYGDRTWVEPALGLTTRAMPFVTMPLGYERAYGGVDPVDPSRWLPENPVGRGYAATGSRQVGMLAPNVTRGPGTLTRVAGFGPIDRTWQPRVTLAGTYDEEWETQRMPLVPHDYDDAFHQCAPLDQRPARPLRGAEPVALTHLHPAGPLAFALPIVRPVFRTRIGRELVVHEPMMHSLILEPDALRFQMVWHAALPCHHRVHELRSTRIDLKELR